MGRWAGPPADERGLHRAAHTPVWTAMQITFFLDSGPDNVSAVGSGPFDAVAPELYAAANAAGLSPREDAPLEASGAEYWAAGSRGQLEKQPHITRWTEGPLLRMSEPDFVP
jgi:hypothetical protein